MLPADRRQAGMMRRDNMYIKYVLRTYFIYMFFPRNQENRATVSPWRRVRFEALPMQLLDLQ